MHTGEKQWLGNLKPLSEGSFTAGGNSSIGLSVKAGMKSLWENKSSALVVVKN